MKKERGSGPRKKQAKAREPEDEKKLTATELLRKMRDLSPNKGGEIKMRLFRPMDERVRNADWEQIIYNDHLSQLTGVVALASGYGTFSTQSYEGEEEKEYTDRHLGYLKSELTPIVFDRPDGYAKDYPDFTLLDPKTKVPIAYVEVKTRGSHNLHGKFDRIPIQPDVIDKHIWRNGKEAKYPEKCLLIVVIENYENKGLKMLWAFISKELALDLHYNYGWKQDMYHPKVASFHDNTKEPFVDALQASIDRKDQG